MSLPTNTDVDQLITSMVNAFIALDEFNANTVQIGEIEHLESRASDLFPCTSILFTGNDGQEYISQRQYQVDIGFQIDVHLYQESEDRVSGNDMILLAKYGYLIKNTIYGFMEGTPPCDNFMLVNPEYRLEMWYQLFSSHVNTAQLDITYHIEGDDTDA